MSDELRSDILLESGTNEFGIMEFTISDQLFGINVAKVKEIMIIEPVKSMQQSHPMIEGVFKPRDQVITVVNLSSYLGLGESGNIDRDILIITSFNKQDFAFHVHTIVGITSISWECMSKPDPLIYGGEEGLATGIADIDDRIVTILDFERIVTEICPEVGIQISDVEGMGDRGRSEKPILVVEDSMLLSKIILESLNRAGYENVVKLDDGKDAWDYLQALLDKPGSIIDHISCVVSDIEMPQMDGHRLAKLIKTHPVLSRVPLVLFSSLISDEMRRKGVELGADAQISKPEIVELVSILDYLTSESYQASL